MLTLIAIAGFVFLLAVIWCIRTMKKGFTPLSADKERWREQFKEEERRLIKEQKEISTEEQQHVLEVAVRDLLRLDEKKETTIESHDGTVTVVAPENSWILAFHGSDQELHSTHKVLHSPGFWTLTTRNACRKFLTIDELMQTFHAELNGEAEEEESVLSVRKRHHAKQISAWDH
ncbi:MAG: hypothetical protein J5803_03235 [Desulfovibrio sp.]|nr:hypothetical protein [Desulfovibrio sp.]